jgi:hypothetical protein
MFLLEKTLNVKKRTDMRLWVNVEKSFAPSTTSQKIKKRLFGKEINRKHHPERLELGQMIPIRKEMRLMIPDRNQIKPHLKIVKTLSLELEAPRMRLDRSEEMMTTDISEKVMITNHLDRTMILESLSDVATIANGLTKETIVMKKNLFITDKAIIEVILNKDLTEEEMIMKARSPFTISNSKAEAILRKELIVETTTGDSLLTNKDPTVIEEIHPIEEKTMEIGLSDQETMKRDPLKEKVVVIDLSSAKDHLRMSSNLESSIALFVLYDLPIECQIFNVELPSTNKTSRKLITAA